VLYEYVHGSPVFVDPTQYLWNPTAQTIFRPGGVFGSPPGASTVLSFVIFFGLASLTTLKGKSKALGCVCLIVCAAALVSTFTRATLIGTTVGVIVFLWLMRSPLLRPTRVLWAGAAVAVVILFALPALDSNTTFQQGVLRSGLAQSTLTQRESYWQLALPIATASAHNLVFGIGTSTLETPIISARAQVPFTMAVTPQVYSNSLHSEYITTLVEQGLIGLGLLVVFLGSAVVRAGRAARETGDPVFAAAAASIISLGLIMSAGTSLLHSPTFAMTMVATGIAANAGAVSHSRRRFRLRGATGSPARSPA
jgi:O-antigen ligase